MTKGEAGELDLLNKAKSGDSDALAELLFGYSAQLRKLANQMIDRKWGALLSDDDLMQETYIDVFQSISRFKGESPEQFFAWLKKVCKNNYLDFQKSLLTDKRGGKRPVNSVEDSYLCLIELISEADSPSRSYSKKEALELLSQAIRQLPPQQLEIIESMDIRGETAREVSAALNCSEGAVYMRRNRALNQLQKALSQISHF